MQYTKNEKNIRIIMNKYQKTDKSWLKIDPKTGFEKQRTVGPELFAQRNPELRLCGFGEAREPGFDAFRHEFKDDLVYAMDFFYECGKKYSKKKEILHSGELLADCKRWWWHVKGRENTVHEGSIIAAGIMEGYPYKRIAGGSVRFKMEKT